MSEPYHQKCLLLLIPTQVCWSVDSGREGERRTDVGEAWLESCEDDMLIEGKCVEGCLPFYRNSDLGET